MPKIINAYAGDNPLTEALNGFAGSFAANTPAMEFARQKSYGLSRDNQSYQTLQDAERAGGYNPNDGNQRAAIVGMATPKEFFEAQRGITATRYGAGDKRATNAYMGAGGSYGSTVQGTNQAEANRVGIENLRTQRLFDSERYKVDNTPETVMTDAGPQIVRRSEVFGQRPVLNEGQAKGAILQTDTPTLTPEQRGQAAGYAPKNPGNVWVYKKPDGSMGNTVDGKLDVQTGMPITGPAMKLEGPNTEGLSGNHQIDQKLLEARNNKDRAVMMIDRLDNALSQPNADQSVGFLGTMSRTFNDIRSQSEATVRLFGGELKDQAFAPNSAGAQAVDGAMNTLFGNPNIVAKAQALGISSAVIRSQVQDLAYMYAKTMDPSGRVGVDDIRRASETVGAMLQDPTAGRAVIADLKQRILDSHDIVERNTKTMYPRVGPQGSQAAPSAAQPVAAPPAQAGGVIRYDAQGNRIP